MKRIEFVKTCGMGCLGLLTTSWILQSCSATTFIQVAVDNDIIPIPITHFIKDAAYRRYIIVKAPKMDYPIVVYRKTESEYQALLLQCTHQGTELNVYGDLISCPAHGSEFTNRGEIISGPASRSLKNYQIVIENDMLFIKLT